MKTLPSLVTMLVLAAVYVLPVRAGTDVTGARLYAQNCAVCHGADGHGGVGVPLALPAFLDSVSNDYLRKTIRYGRPGRVMPSFAQLSDAQAASIVRYIRAWSKTSAPHFSNAPVRGDAERGARLYAVQCAACHGADGSGGRGTGVTFSRPRSLPIIAPALRNAGFLAAASDQMIKATLNNGRAGTPMVSFRQRGLSARDIDDLVAYVRSFATATSTTPKASAAGPAALIYDSPYNLEETVKNVKQAAAGKNFRIIRVQYFDQGLVPKGAENTKRVIVYFCNFPLLNTALTIDPRVGLFLPCRVTIVEHAGKVQVMSIDPKRLSTLFNNEELDRICDKMTHLYRDILEEATL